MTAPVATSDMCSRKHTPRAWWDWWISVSLSQTWHISSSTRTHCALTAMGCLSLMLMTHTHKQAHTELYAHMKTHVRTHTHTQQPIHPFSFAFVRQYFSIPLSGSLADILLYTVSALSCRVQPISLSELRYSLCTGQFQYVTSMSTHKVHWVERNVPH